MKADNLSSFTSLIDFCFHFIPFGFTILSIWIIYPQSPPPRWVNYPSKHERQLGKPFLFCSSCKSILLFYVCFFWEHTGEFIIWKTRKTSDRKKECSISHFLRLPLVHYYDIKHTLHLCQHTDALSTGIQFYDFINYSIFHSSGISCVYVEGIKNESVNPLRSLNLRLHKNKLFALLNLSHDACLSLPILDYLFLQEDKLFTFVFWFHSPFLLGQVNPQSNVIPCSTIFQTVIQPIEDERHEQEKTVSTCHKCHLSTTQAQFSSLRLFHFFADGFNVCVTLDRNSRELYYYFNYFWIET